MFLKNVTASYQNFLYKNGACHKHIAPSETVVIVDADETDPTIKSLVELGRCEIVDSIGETTKTNTIPNVQVIEEVSEDEEVATVVHCPAVKADGKVCDAIVTLEEGEDTSVPHFCGRHKKKENPADYEMVNGKWVKKQETEKKEAEQVNEIPEYENE